MNSDIASPPPNPLTTSDPHHKETSQLICNANQLTGFYMMGDIDRQWVNKILKIHLKTSIK